MATEEGYSSYVAGKNLKEGLEMLSRFRFWVTFGVVFSLALFGGSVIAYSGLTRLTLTGKIPALSVFSGKP